MHNILYQTLTDAAAFLQKASKDSWGASDQNRKGCKQNKYLTSTHIYVTAKLFCSDAHI